MSDPSTSVRYAFPKFKVFIYGVEVTDDVTSVNKTENDGGAPNTCQITLLNEFDKYIYTTSDIIALSGIPSGVLTIPWVRGEDAVDQDDAGLFLGAAQGTGGYEASINKIPPGRKRDILLAKNRAIQNVDIADIKDVAGNSIATDPTLLDYYGGPIRGYPIGDGLPVFSPMDPVRVAMRDPFNPKRWYWYFSGLVSDLVDNVDENNVKTLTVVVEDPTKLFRYTRAFINPGLLDASKVIKEGADLKIMSLYSSFLRNMTLPEIFFTLVFGPDKAGTLKILEQNVTISGDSSLSTALRGIGHFAIDESSIFVYGPGEIPDTRAGKSPSKIDSLELWQALIDHEVQPSDMITMATENDRASGAAFARSVGMLKDSDGKLNLEAVIDYIGTHWDEYLIDGGKLMLLIPSNFGVNNINIMDKDIIQGYPLNSEWHSMGEILKDVVDRVQFSMYATPKGDLVVEFPLYDFDPDDFGLEPMSSSELINKLISSSATVGSSNFASHLIMAEDSSILPGRDRGPYGKSYIIHKRDTYKIESAFVDEKVFTMAACPWQIVQNWVNIPNTAIVGKMAVSFLPSLIPIYGMRPAPITPRGYIATNNAAAVYANITLAKFNCDAHTANVLHVPNVSLWINRPIYIQKRNFIGTTKQISQSLTWGASGDMTTTSDLHAIRTWTGRVAKKDPTQPIFTSVGGLGSNPLNYAVMFRDVEEMSADTLITSAQSVLPEGEK